ncbi:MAG: diguanylate cyclase [Acidimicrobiales bacterium]
MTAVMRPHDARELAPRVWWVGGTIPGDSFQCHVYLIEQGDQSVVVDPGSALTADHVMDAIDEIVGLRNVRWLIASHSDPDVVTAIPSFVRRGIHPDAVMVTQWRSAALTDHADLGLPTWLIEENDWRLDLEDRGLRFAFTPYVHFPGAFCTFDEASGILFSSDLFGGFSGPDGLFAESMSYFDEIRVFHEHYMPGREFLAHAVAQLSELPIATIAPQHGRIIPAELVEPIMAKVADLECGIYLMASEDPGLAFLLEANRAMKQATEVLTAEPDFSRVAPTLSAIFESFVGAAAEEFWVREGTTTLCFAAETDFTGQPAVPGPAVASALAGDSAVEGGRVAIALPAPDGGSGGAAMVLDSAPDLDGPTTAIIERMAPLIEVALERETMRRLAELDRARLYDRATHDPLTGLYNRAYLEDVAERILAFDDRHRTGIAAVMIDIDHFKDVNDTHGHAIGDRVLARVAAVTHSTVRGDDIAVRLGGEEFLVLSSGLDPDGARFTAERLREAVANTPGDGPAVTISAGVANRRVRESLESLLGRADEALYRAKENGRDRVECSG